MKLVEFRNAQGKQVAINTALISGLAKGHEDKTTIVIMTRSSNDVDEDFMVMGSFADTKNKLEEEAI